MAEQSPITADDVRSRLDYDADLGVFTWRALPDTGHQSRAWNAKFAGAKAGSFNAAGYVEIAWILPGGKRFRTYAHRLAWLCVTGEWPPHYIDHIDGDRANNRFANLRLATNQQNTFNSTRPRRGNISGIKGVSWDKERRKLFAGITLNGKMIALGRYDSKDDAAAAYAEAAARYHGEFAAISRDTK